MELNLNQNVPEDIIKGLKILIDLGYINHYNSDDVIYYLEKPYKYTQTIQKINQCPKCEDYHEDKNKKCDFCIEENIENREQETLRLRNWCENE